MSTHGRRRARAGYSLMEIAMVLAIVALLVASLMLYFQNASNANKTKETLEEITAVRAAVSQLYGGQAIQAVDTTNDVTSIVARSGLLPSRWLSGDTIKNPFGGDLVVNVGAWTVFVTLQVSGLPQSACTALGGQDFGPDVNDVDVNTELHQAPNTKVSPQDLTAACKPGYANFLVWDFKD